MAIRNITLKEAARAVGFSQPEMRSLVKDGYATGSWWPVGLRNGKGARLEARKWGEGFRFRLNGYAPDGSDVQP